MSSGDSMSVCIAAISEGASDCDIIAIVDRKASSGDFSNEDATTKSLWLGSAWLVLFAGNDITPAVPIIGYANTLLKGKANTLSNVVLALEESYQECLSNYCYATVLGRWTFQNIEDFRKTGRKQLGADVFDSLCDKIDRTKLQITFLVCGLDDKGKPHLLTVRNPGIAAIHDIPGYYAIGNGALAAMTLLSFFRQSVICSLEQTIYNVFTAKLMAETASDVGDQPYFWRLNKNRLAIPTHLVPQETFDEVKKAWNSSGKPLVPDGILTAIKNILATESSSSMSGKSEPEK